ncbi:MAG: L,D-transpeptidase [Verrucomicrobiaceae bacterium]
MPLSTSLRLATLSFAAAMLSQCTSATSGLIKPDEVVVSVKEQKLGLYEGGQLKKAYKISTSKFGLGSAPGSCRTPLGHLQIVSKIGDGLPAGAVLKARSWNGEVLTPNAPGRDPVVSRILWLRGLESCNRNTQNRLIYIHGTPEERNLGRPASFGCVRMGMKDVIKIFNMVPVGTSVLITENKLSHRLHAVEAEAQ